MERLSEKLKDVLYETIGALSQVEEDIIKAALDRLDAYENSGMEPCDYSTMSHALQQAKRAREDLTEMICIVGGVGLDRLQELAHAEKEGCLVVLPCKAGDWVYRVHYKEIRRHHVCQVHIGQTPAQTFFSCYGEYFGIEEIGKTVFLSREEAEAALRSMEGST